MAAHFSKCPRLERKMKNRNDRRLRLRNFSSAGRKLIIINALIGFHKRFFILYFFFILLIEILQYGFSHRI